MKKKENKTNQTHDKTIYQQRESWKEGMQKAILQKIQKSGIQNKRDPT
jgi:hypothetical protein